jgi:hypothetical protein
MIILQSSLGNNLLYRKNITLISSELMKYISETPHFIFLGYLTSFHQLHTLYSIVIFSAVYWWIDVLVNKLFCGSYS